METLKKTIKEGITIKLKEIMTKDVTSVKSQTDVTGVAKVMEQINVGIVPVVDNNKVIGVVTDRDITLRVVAAGKKADAVQAKDIMTKDVISGTSDMDVHEAAQIMADNQIRRLPVVDNGKLVGMVAIGDLAVESIFVNEAGDALSSISRPSQPLM